MVDDLLRSRRAQLPFAVVALLAFPLAWLPPSQPAMPQLIIAAVLTLTLGAAVLLIPWEIAAPWVRPVPALAYLAVVGLLRDAEGGATSGYAPLLMLPLFWIALYGHRIELAAVTAGIALTLAIPILTVGEPSYPPSEWRRLLLWLLIAPTVGGAVQRLVAESRDANEALEAASRTDALTGLPNRRAWNDIIATEIVRARRNGSRFTVAMLDIDHFKRFNDTHGHQAGDDFLVACAREWASTLRAVDTLSRWGGEEFAVLLTGAEAQGAVPTLERLRAATPSDQTVSVGVATWRVDETPDDVLGRADDALYEAKQAGRDRVVVANIPTET